MPKDNPILKSIMWTIIILIFPITSGVIVTVMKMTDIQILITQGCFMLLSLIIPILYMCKAKISFKEIGIVKVDSGNVKKLLFFVPVVLAEIPLIIVGISFNSLKYVLALTFFALAVGISEEVYFRGIILRLLEKKYTFKIAIIFSALIFGIGHIASIIADRSIIVVSLQIVNALVFGILAAEMVTISKSIIPTIIWHFAFNFVNYITLAYGINEIIVVGIQEFIMITYASYLWNKIPAKVNTFNEKKLEL